MKKWFFFLGLILYACKSNQDIVESEAPKEGNNILITPPSFSLNYNKNPVATTTKNDSGKLVLPQLLIEGNCKEPLTEITFNKAINLIEQENTIIDKFELSKKIIEKNCLTTFQIKRVGDFFTSESKKLQLFELAYNYCYDTQNYFTLEKNFVLNENKKSFKKIMK